MKKVILVVTLVIACIFGGVMFYVPEPDAGYPKDCTQEEYLANVEKNNSLIIQKLEEIDKPTLRETMKEYEKVAPSMKFYPTAFETMCEAGDRFAANDKIPFFKLWRQDRFMEKHFPVAMEMQREYEAKIKEYSEKSEIPKNDVNHKAYIYKDGSVIMMGPGGMSVQYPDGGAE